MKFQNNKYLKHTTYSLQLKEYFLRLFCGVRLIKLTACRLRHTAYGLLLTAGVVVIFGVGLLSAGGTRGKKSALLIARRVSPGQYKRSVNDMTITFIDVGQGNSVLVEAPSGIIMLYDAGGNPEWLKSDWDPGMAIISPLLDKKMISRIDYMVMSHAHGDHIGGLPSLVDNYEVKQFYDPGYPYTTMNYQSLLEKVKEKKAGYDIIMAGSGDKFNFGPGIKAAVFSPPKIGYFTGTNSDCNNSSILLKITYKNVSILLTGDIEEKAELYSAGKYGEELTSNIMQVPHHGSSTSSTRAFLEKVLPEVAVIPVGKNNTFGHPTPEALSNIEKIGAEIFRTDYDGNVVVYTNGETFMVETER